MKLATTSGVIAALALATVVIAAQGRTASRDAVARGVSYLEREVPRWRAEHPCYSCHNNGDAARALIAASARGHQVDRALAGTIDWLAHPEQWNQNKGEGGLDDKPLAHVQFAGGLTSAHEAKIPAATASALARAAALVAADQKPDGSWRLQTSQGVGSPVTYGAPLVTWSAMRTLRATGDRRFEPAIARGEAWIREMAVETVLDASAVILAIERATDDRAAAQRRRCLDILKRGQAPDGGWGPYVTSAAEPFDTAVALLALKAVEKDSALQTAIERGMRFLIDRQLEDGSWPETTRPPNQESYAQRISTTAWALLALMESSAR
jgi:hypothetical protein